MDWKQDLVGRLTSRKFILCLVVLALTVIGYGTGQLTYEQLVNIVLIAVGVFSGAEGLADAAGAFRRSSTPVSEDNPSV